MGGMVSVLQNGVFGAMDQKLKPDDGLHGVWLTTVNNADFPSKPGLSAAAQEKQIDGILDRVKKMGLNAVFLQVRPGADALYKSDCYPWSKVLTGEQGKDPGYDPLAYFIQEAHSKGLKLLAWVNPYRVQTQADTSGLADTNPAKLHADWDVTTGDGQLYLNPGIPDVRKYIEKGVAEIVHKYNVDGIVFDDYFYPSKDFDDAASYKQYGAGKPLDEWRRSNVNALVSELHKMIKSTRKGVSFGISPAGVWANEAQSPGGSKTIGASSTYYDNYADSKLWVKNKWVDFICPQIYWEIGNDNTDYTKLLKWWADTTRGTGVKLYIAHDVDKVQDGEPGWQSPDQIVRQLCAAKGYSDYGGSVFFDYKDLVKDPGGVTDCITKYYRGQLSAKSFGRQLTVSYPTDNMTVDDSQIKAVGMSDVNFPLLINGVAASRSLDGYFCQVINLTPGKNVIAFQHKGQIKTLTVHYDMSILRSVQPANDLGANAGSVINITAVAHRDATVFAQIGKQQISMYKTDYSGSDNGDDGQYGSDYAQYACSFTIPQNAVDGQDYGKISVTVLWGGFSKTVQGGDIKVSSIKAKKGQTCIATVKTALPSNNQYVETYLYPDSMYRPVAYPQLPGSWDYVEMNADGTPKKYISGSNTYYMLSCGLMLPSFNLTLQTKAAPALNQIKGISQSSTENDRYTEFKFGFTQKVTYNAATDTDFINPGYNGNGKRDYSINSFDADGFSITFFNTAKEEALQLKNNPLFSSVSVARNGTQVKYTFKLKTRGRFFGVNPYYDQSGNFILDFKNPWDGKISDLKIAIDAGHGGFDFGAVAGSANEKTVNLTFALNVRNLLISKYGLNPANIYMTRTTDTLLAGDKVNDLQLRTLNMINFHPDLSLCIHQNDGGGEGFETYYFQPYSQGLAASVQANLAQAYNNCGFAHTDRGFKFCSENAYYSCREPQFPSILTECGFIDNPQDRSFITGSAGTNAICGALAKSAVDYANLYMK